MTKQTQPYRRSVRHTVGSGIGSLMGGSGKQYYILEHKISSKYHKVGEAQEIIVDDIELGRSAKCQVRFDESFTTVSRQHAAIKKDGEKWKLVHLSEGNSTLLNGDKIAKEWYLQNGDEIQLSVRGPRLGFIVPTGKNATVGSIGFTRRLSLFRKQALRPYKQAITALSIVLILAVGGLSTSNIMQWIKTKELEKTHAKALAELEKEKHLQDSLLNVQRLTFERRLADAEGRARSMQTRINQLNESNTALKGKIEELVHVSTTNDHAIKAVEPYVYFVKVTKTVVTWPNGPTKEYDFGGSGSGFLLDDGRFVTCRHVTEPWFYFVQGGEIDKDMILFNYAAQNGGKVVAHLTAFSSSGDSFSFTSDQMTVNRSTDREGVDEDGVAVRLAQRDNTDWAYIRTSKTQGLKYDANMSRTLEGGTILTFIGFPLGLGGGNLSNIQPHRSNGTTSASGLTDGRIIAANVGYEGGNSGCPVFCTDASGNLIVVGIVATAMGRTTGSIVPISAIN